MNATFAPPLAVVLSFHGVVERIEQPEIQVNHVDVESFERIVDRVRTSYHVVALDDVAAAVVGEGSLPENAAASCERAFAVSSAEGLLWLVSQGLDQPLPPALVYWRLRAPRSRPRTPTAGRGCGRWASSRAASSGWR